MMEHSISCPTESVVTNTGGHPVVRDTSCSQPVSSFEPIIKSIKSAHVMLVSSRVVNVFPTPVMRTSLWRSRYDRDMPMHPTKEVDHRRLPDAPVVTPPPFRCYIIWNDTRRSLMWLVLVACRPMGMNYKCGNVLQGM